MQPYTVCLDRNQNKVKLQTWMVNNHKCWAIITFRYFSNTSIVKKQLDPTIYFYQPIAISAFRCISVTLCKVRTCMRNFYINLIGALAQS